MSETYKRHDSGRAHDIPVVLSVAGSDCSGGAGIQADIKTCMSAGVYGATVLTAVTAQNPYELKRIRYVGDRMLREQLECIFNSLKPDAIKIGMIPCPEAAEIISEYLAEHHGIPVVIDPVMSTTTGGSLNNDSNKTANMICRVLFPLAELVTPNLPELWKLSCGDPELSVEARVRIVMEKYNVKRILVKGGHAVGKEATDTLYNRDGSSHIYTARRIDSSHTHGTGCTLSSAIACGLAKKLDMKDAIAQAKRLVTTAIENAARHPLFTDNGPLIHFEPDVKS